MTGLDTFWSSWHFQNLLIAVLVAVMFFIFRKLRTREYWRSAFTRVFERRMIRICFGILCVYTLIALLDSIGFHPVLRDDAGEPLRHSETKRIIRDPDGLSVLDWMLTGLRDSREQSYSAPFATHLLSKEMMLNEDGEIVNEKPALQHPRRHILGTDRVGNDVLYLSLKGVRTGMIIGAFTTLLVIPFAVFFGVIAGYFGGWIDDVVQYIYSVLSSIPAFLLIVAFISVYGRGLFQLCLIMGITSWTGLCRVLRGETLKLRESDFVQASEAMGVSRYKIMLKHLIPNIMHIVLITAVLSFSGRVLAEAVLSYLGVGVGADTISWGVMINDARQELARSPIIWWKLFAAFIFMLGLVLPANLFGDAVRDALDPKLRTQ